MPKSGIAQQWCPCGSNLRPYLALAITARSLHIVPRENSAPITLYICENCVSKFDAAISQQQHFFRAVHSRVRDRILGAVAGTLLTVWEEISARVPK